MNSTVKGLRKKKTIRGEEISEKTSQINMIVMKEGSKKFADLLPKKEAEQGEAPTEEKPAEEKKEEAPKEESKPEEEPKEKAPTESDPEQEPKESEAKKEELANPDEEPKS